MKTANDQVFKIAILGGGLNSAVGMAHFSALILSNRYKIVAGSFSRNRLINSESGSLYNIDEERVYSNLDDLINVEKDKIDCIVILTPTDQHVEQVSKCIEAGIHVICEKALAVSSEQASLLRENLLNKNGFLSVIYNYLGYPMLRELKDLIYNNKFGKINHIHIEMPQEGFKREVNGVPLKPQDWRLRDVEIPIISLDLGVHLHMIIKYLTSEKPIQVVGVSSSYGNFSNIIDDVNCIIEYTNNVICNMWYSKVATGQRNGLKIRIFGDYCSAEWYQEDSEKLIMANNQGHRWIVDRGSENINIANQNRYTRFKAGHPAGFIEALANYYVDIADDLKNFYIQNPSYKKSSFGLEDSIEGLKLLEAIAISGKSKSWKKI